MRFMSMVAVLSASLLACGPVELTVGSVRLPDDSAEGEGDVAEGEAEGEVPAGEGEGDVSAEGEGDIAAGEGEGERGEGEGEGEGEGDIGEGEGEPVVVDPCAGVVVDAPPIPVIVYPVANTIDDAVTFTVQGPLQNVSRAEVEIWRARDGARTNRLWLAVLEGATVREDVSSSQGSYEGDAVGRGLLPFKEHIVRVRHARSVGSCTAFSAWSSEVLYRTDDGSKPLFDPSVVRTIEVNVPQSSIDAMNAQASPGGCFRFDRDLQPGSVRVDGLDVPDVGISIKGGCGSSRDFNGKPSLKIDFNPGFVDDGTCPDDRRVYGQTKLTLNNGVQDNTAMRERLGYGFYNTVGVPAPRTASVRVVVNGVFYGVYTMIETIDRRFLARRFSSNDGMMYEGAYWCDLVENNVPATLADRGSCFEPEFSTDACSTVSPGEDATDWELLRTFTQQIQDARDSGDFYPAIRSVIDMDAFFTAWSADMVLAHWDGYFVDIVNNYRVYHHPTTGLWHFVPWGIDQTFNSGRDTVVRPFGNAGPTLVQACLADAECRADYAVRLDQMRVLFANAGLREKADAIQAQLEPHIMDDTRAGYSVGSWRGRVDSLRNWINGRPAFIASELQTAGF
jgi:spore coat protein CotH